MVEISDIIPEILSFIIGLILFILGVPSVVEIGLMIVVAVHEVYPTTYGFLYIIMLRLLGWFITIEPILRIIFLVKDRIQSSTTF